MTEKIYLVTDLGPGDGGKGGVVHKISCMTRAHTILKRGGAQGSHGVRTSKGESFNFSQWGCGTFEGVNTHITSQMVVSPEGLLNEADALERTGGLHNAFDLLTIDAEALCATPYHGIASRIKELARGDDPRGTIGTGVGEAYRDQSRCPELVIKASDLASGDSKDRLAAVREQIRCDLDPILHGEFLPADQARVEEEIALLTDDGFLEYVVSRFQEVARRAKIVSSDYLGERILSQDGVAVVECSHGVLTDSEVGFHPHTSALRTLPSFTHTMLKEAGFAGQVVNIGVTRAYAIRHGAGPLPTQSDRLQEALLPGSNKNENRYQGKVRVGSLDLVLLRYAIEVCGGPAVFDGLAITWFDQIQENGVWRIADRYQNSSHPDFFALSGDIRVRSGATYEQRECLTQLLFGCKSEVRELALPSAASRDQLYSICADVFHSGTGVPVRMVSFGPTEQDKLCK